LRVADIGVVGRIETVAQLRRLLLELADLIDRLAPVRAQFAPTPAPVLFRGRAEAGAADATAAAASGWATVSF